MKVAFMSSEVIPFAKTGGLADVSGTLPIELKKSGIDEIVVFMPAYREAKKSGHPLAGESVIKFDFDGKKTEAGILRGKLSDEVNIILIENDAYYDRGGIYVAKDGDFADNARRFSFFSLASLHYLKDRGFHPDVIHCNDWQSGLVPLLLKTHFRGDDFFSKTATCITVHNLAYQGNFSKEQISFLKLPQEYLGDEGIKFYDSYSFLKSGLVYSTVVNAVSRKYSREIQTPEFGCGMENILTKRSDTVFGILNGVDYSQWNPSGDKLIPSNFDENDLSGKGECKKILQEKSGLDVSEKKPLLGVVTRLAYQKGIDIIADVVSDIVAEGAQFVVLGTGEKKYEDAIQGMAEKYRGQVSVVIGFDNALAHLIEAGSDMFLMPSRYEPCGLNQMYSLKYGTVPVVRSTGGLDDTIIDFESDRGKGNGFKFDELSAPAFLSKLKTACRYYRSDEWRTIMKNGMKCDFSWNKSAEEYIELYKKALQIKNS